jgi:two-component system, NarL family, response regulator NreC
MSGKINIMLVDDHTLFRSGLKMLLEKQADLAVVSENACAADAIASVGKDGADLVLMDIGLPDINGLEATRLIKEQYPHIKILVLTMHNDEPYLLKALEAGASGYMLKEAASTELVSAIRTAMKGEMAIHTSMVKMLVNKALTGKPDTAGDETDDILTNREREVLHYIGMGYTNREIADILIVSVKTVEKHKAHIMEKLNLKRRHQLVEYAIKNGFINIETNK